MDAHVFEAHRPLLFSIAYRMLGSVAEAEDLTQDAYVRTHEATGVRDARAFLVTTITRLSIDRLRSAQHRRESYVGQWLPEPLVGVVPDVSEDAELAESLSFSFLVLLETLSPAERAAFLLREVFSYPYAEIAPALGRSADACRQLVHRARERVASGSRRFEPSKQKHRELLRAFLNACSEGDVDALAALLASDAELHSDGGGETRAARVPLYGSRRIARFLVNLAAKTAGVGADIAPVNGRPGVVLRGPSGPVAVLVFETAHDELARVYIVAAPSKLTSV